MSFTSICQKLIDNWVTTTPSDPAATKDVYKDVVKGLFFRMRLTEIKIIGDDMRQWKLRKIGSWNVKNPVIDVDGLLDCDKIGDFPDQSFMETSVFPAYRKVLETRLPLIDQVNCRIFGFNAIYDRIIIPQKNINTPEWLLVCGFGRFLSPAQSVAVEVDALDERIINLLLQGYSAKEIGNAENLSNRTIEHRLERLKKSFGARSLAHLAAVFLSSATDRKMTINTHEQQ